MRELRSATGLSLAALAAKTPYSKSSWERYLNGKALPPRQAVEQLCRLAGRPEDRPLALWELAESAWSARTGERAGVATGPGTSSTGTSTSAGAGSATGPGPGPGPGAGGSDVEVGVGAGKGAVGVPDPAAAARVPPGPSVLPDRSRGPARHVARGSARHVAGVLAGCAAVAAGVLLVPWAFGSGDGAPEDAGSPSRSGARPSCFGDACTGKNAESTKCSSADHPPATLAERRFAGGTVVKVRRSVPCGTVWARIDRGREGDRIEITAPGIEPQQNEVRDRFDVEGSLSTPMAAANPAAFPEVESCLVRDGERTCFPVGPRGGG